MFGESEAAAERRRQDDLANQRFGMKRSREDRMDLEKPKGMVQLIDESMSRITDRMMPGFVKRYHAAKIYNATLDEVDGYVIARSTLQPTRPGLPC